MGSLNSFARLLFEDSSLPRWTLFSVFSFLFVLGLTSLLHQVLGVNDRVAFLIPLIGVFFLNFFTMRYVVYGRPSRTIGSQFLAYTFSAAGFRAIEYAAYWISLEFFSLHYLIAITLILPTSFLLKYLFYRFAVFGSGPRRSGERT
jgi:hypothetical protein